MKRTNSPQRYIRRSPEPGVAAVPSFPQFAIIRSREKRVREEEGGRENGSFAGARTKPPQFALRPTVSRNDSYPRGRAFNHYPPFCAVSF